MLQSFKALRPALTRGVRQQVVLQRRTFLAPTAALRADIVQDLYIKELKAYKLPPVKPSDAEGHVQTFSPPKAPKSPEEGDIANDLKTYEAQQVEVEGNEGGNAAVGGGGEEWSDWFEELEDDEEKPAH